MSAVGEVCFVGAGPGAADLMTLRGRSVIEQADVVVYAGALVPSEVLTWASPDARLVDSQGLTLDEITHVVVDAVRAGQKVARLHSGDPSVYSAVAEQTRRLEEAGVVWTIVPGVPSFAAAAAVLGKELTVPGVAQSVVLTRMSRRSTAMPEGETLAAFAATGATLVIHLAVQIIDEAVAELVDVVGEDCPVAVCGFVSQPDEIILRGTIGTVAKQVAEAGITKTAVIVVGRALTAGDFQDSHLYSCARQLARR